MVFAWPFALGGLLVVPMLIGAYLWALRRRRKYPVRYASLSTVRSALPKRNRWRRHIPFALLALSMALLVVASARPRIEREVPLNRTTIMLALDMSSSMCMTDVDPNRVTVAKEAARNFVADQPAGTRIGLVAFSSSAQVVVAPTTDRDELVEAISGLRTTRGTAIGSATLRSIDAIAAINPDVAPSGVDLTDPDGPGSVDRDEALASDEYVPDIVVLLTDGANSEGVPPVIAAEQAVDRRVRVFTIGFGTDEIAELICSAEDSGPGTISSANLPPGVDLEDFARFLRIDEESLVTVSEMTGGTYTRANDAEELKTIFQELPSQLELQTEESEISWLLLLPGAVLAVAAIVLSFLWNPGSA